MMRLVLQAKAVNGGFKILPSQKERLVKILTNMEGKDLVVTVENKTNKRSLDQNAYYWTIVVSIVKDGLIDQGFERDDLDKDVVHEYLKGRFLKKDVVNETTGEYITITRNSSKIDTVEFMNYIADIQQWAAEFLGINIPDPDPAKSTTKNFPGK